MEYLPQILEVMNSNIGLAAAGFIILFIINKIFSAKPGWAKYEGLLISGVKWAENVIGDDVTNKSLHRADEALKYFIKAYEKAHDGKSPSKKLLKEVELGLPIVHDKIEAKMAEKKKQAA